MPLTHERERRSSTLSDMKLSGVYVGDIGATTPSFERKTVAGPTGAPKE